MKVFAFPPVLVVLVVLLFAACSEPNLAAPECVADEDCREGMICDLGVCTSDRSVEPFATPDDPTPGDQAGDSDEGDNVSPGDLAPGDTSGDGDGDGDSGSGDLAPGDGDGGDTDPVVGESCQQEYGACDPSLSDHGGFACVERSDGTGVCFHRCNRPAHADSCATGRYCWDLTGVGPTCLPSECETHSDCGSDTCLRLDNSYGVCTASGPLALGASCTAGVSADCQQGLYCSGPLNQPGECVPICDPFGASPCSDPIHEACTVRWRRSGVCTTYPYLADTLTIFEQCSDPGDWCTDAVQCRSVSSGSFCLKYCRPGKGDCNSVFFSNGTPTICNNYWFAGEQAIGICVGACVTNNDCSTGWHCVDQKCRIPCPSGNAQTDCCNGQADCPFQCIDNYCA